MDSLNKKAPIGALLCFLLLFGTSCRFGKQKSYEGTFDITVLIGKNIDEVRKVLGKPLENPPDPLKPQKRLFENLYDKQGQLLLIYFDPNTRKIESFHIVSSIGYDSIKDVLKVGNLDFKNTNEYWIEPGERYFSNTYNGFTIHFNKN
jgi:hypothetical protein